jgi:hypothetical protein
MRSSTAFICTVIAVESLFGLLLIACAGSTAVPVGEPAQRAGKVTQEIEVLADINEVRRPYKMVGYVEAERLAAPGQENVNFKDLLPILKQRALELEAEALVEVETRMLEKEGRRGLKATAIAIVFTD